MSNVELVSHGLGCAEAGEEQLQCLGVYRGGGERVGAARTGSDGLQEGS